MYKNQNDEQIKMFLTPFFARTFEKFSEFYEKAVPNGKLEGQKVLFISDAITREPIKFFTWASKRALKKLGLKINEVKLEKMSKEDLKRIIDEPSDKPLIVVLGGGNTEYLLMVLKDNNHGETLKDAVKCGKIILVGESAGAAVLHSTIEPMRGMDDPDATPDLDNYDGLNLLDEPLKGRYVLVHDKNKFYGEKIKNLMDNPGKFNFLPIPDYGAVWIIGKDVRIDNTIPHKGISLKKPDVGDFEPIEYVYVLTVDYPRNALGKISKKLSNTHK